MIVIKPVNGSSAAHSQTSIPDRQGKPITPTVSFPCPCSATITGPTTSTSTITSTTIARGDDLRAYGRERRM